MQQRQLRLGDILDDYCPRERRLTNHAIVAMVGQEVKQTRCTTCDAEHEYKHARVPRQRRKQDTPAALYSSVAAGGPKRVPHESEMPEPESLDAAEVPGNNREDAFTEVPAALSVAPSAVDMTGATDARSDDVAGEAATDGGREAKEVADVEEVNDVDDENTAEEGPVHRPLIRATLPRPEGQPPPARPGPDFTIRQPGGRQNRFRPRHQRGGSQFFGNRSNGNMGGAGSMRGGMPRQGGGRPPHGSTPSRPSRRQGGGGSGRKRSK